MHTEQRVASHYRQGALEDAILSALRASGKDIERIAPSDLSAVDEFHLGWRAATIEFAIDLALSPGMHVLDIGSGIGGPARCFAEVHGCRVTGVDLTDEFVAVARALTQRCGLSDRVSFQQASALALPFADGTFDAATMIHVGMNIEDKAKLFCEVRRTLKPGASFGVYDVMRIDGAEIPYPMPWAATAETSFVETPATYRQRLQDAGFGILSERSRRDQALALGREMREKAAREGPPPLGLHVLMGPGTAERLGNVMSTLERGTIAPIQIIATAA